MIKYELKRMPIVEGFVFFDFECITVKKSDVEKLKKQGWTLHRKKYFIFSHLFDLWQSLNTDQKISIIAIFTASVIGIIALI
jgi:hypothetical protein